MLPHEVENEHSLAEAIYLDKHLKERQELAVMSAISRLFKRG
ncbi:DUF6890 family protein [Photobacterium frigidiphilum]